MKKKILNIAHRGASAHAPENTMAAFELAIQQGADMIEMDLHVTRDGKVVICHDSNLLRTAGKDISIESASLEDLQRFDVGSWFDPRFSQERIPTLQQVLERFGGRVALNLELKANHSDPSLLIASALKVLQTYPQARCILSSFQWPLLLEFRKQEKKIPLAILLTGNYWEQAFQFAKAIGPISIHPEWTSVTSQRVEQAHKARWKVYPYVANAVEEMKKLISDGVDGIMTDRPDRLCKLLQPL
ncbi:MAG: glycerophosphodiester phosphodiesterase [Deltaproteobacteria bacterium]|nr:glycerophosphodiester phosphodiesterase [Deltaproteobacteria bacterium]